MYIHLKKINKHSFSNMISQPDASYWKDSNMKHAMWNVPQNIQLLKNISGKHQYQNDYVKQML